jgi:hypothetical protein
MIRWKSTYRRSVTDAERPVTERSSEVPGPPAQGATAAPGATVPPPEPPAAGPEVESPPEPPRPVPEPQHPPHAGGFPPELESQAAANSGGWVYEVDPGFSAADPVPLAHIVGAWRIGENGAATGEFVPNGQFLGPPPPGRRSRRRLLLPIILGLVALLAIAAVIVLLVTQSSDKKSADATPKPAAVAASSAPTASKPAAGKGASTSRPSTTPAPVRTAPASSGSLAVPPRKSSHPTAPAAVHLEVLATQRVWVCVQNHAGTLLVNGRILPAGSSTDQFVSSDFRIFTGNGGVSFRINGRVHQAPSNVDPVGYSITSRGVTQLPGRLTPPCA